MSVVGAPPGAERDVERVSFDSGAGPATDGFASQPAAQITPVGARPAYRRLVGQRYQRSTWMVAGGFIVLLAIATVLAVTQLAPGPLPPPTGTVHGSGTVITTRTTGIVVRLPGGQVTSLAAASTRLVAGDGQSLLLSSVRPGDTVVMQAANVLVDTAQTRVRLPGIVASAPDPDGDVMTVQVSPIRTVLVDITGQTRINGALASVASRMSIRDAAQVRIDGILDKTFDEMTETRTIERIRGS